MSFFARLYELLLPTSRVFHFGPVQSYLRRLFEGLAGLPADARTFVDLVFLDLLPFKTRALDQWDDQFGVTAGGLDEAQRQSRLSGMWAASGGQSPRYIQDVLHAAGFEVFIHQWWTEPVVVTPVPRDPRLYLSGSGGAEIAVQCGEPEALCGEDGSATSFPILAPVSCGQSNDPVGYLLVNKIRTAVTISGGCGDDNFECSTREPHEDPIENVGFCGQPLVLDVGLREYDVPADPDRWRYMLYFGGEVFPELAPVDELRRDEFEDLLLKICPGEQWLGILVNYTQT
jgi:hypothetical protein